MVINDIIIVAPAATALAAPVYVVIHGVDFEDSDTQAFELAGDAVLVLPTLLMVASSPLGGHEPVACEGAPVLVQRLIPLVAASSPLGDNEPVACGRSPVFVQRPPLGFDPPLGCGPPAFHDGSPVAVPVGITGLVITKGVVIGQPSGHVMVMTVTGMVGRRVSVQEQCVVIIVVVFVVRPVEHGSTQVAGKSQ